MGAFYSSICLPGEQSLLVEEAIERWLALRGFEKLDEPMLFDLDGDTERCAYVLWNARWTVVVFSKYEEERRLLRELQTWNDTLLYVWVQDSEVWGYDVLDGGGFVASFSSDPGYYQSFEETEPGGPERPLAEAGVVCRRLGNADWESALQRLHRRSARFEEELCAELCRMIGAEAAMVSYDDLERDSVRGLAAWRCRRLFFRQRQGAAVPEVALHQLSLDGSTSGATWTGSQTPTSLMPKLHEEMEEVRRRTRSRWWVLRPLARMANWWRRWRGDQPALYGTAEASRPKTPSGGTSTFPDRRMLNERHACRIILALGVTAEAVSGKPSAVFSFRVGETLVNCTSRRLDKLADVLRRPSRSEVVRDDKYSAVGLEARYVLFKLPPMYLAGTTEPSYLGLHVVQAPAALYVFLFRSLQPPCPATELAIRSTVESFKLVAQEARGTDTIRRSRALG